MYPPPVMPTRRRFLAQSAAASAALLLAPRTSRAADSRIDIRLDEPIATIAPEIYGHFAEHLGGVVYDGIWVGEGSKIPNVGGIRTALVEHLKRINAPVVRWPGGCFADSYDWRDGIGAAASRPRRTNFWLNTKVPPGPQQYDPNAFGTVEFVRFCRLAGAQPYLAANLRSLPPRDFYQWVEFCNSPAGTTTMAEARAAQGEKDPLNVRYWGVGNEPWGCGGDFSPEDYAAEFRRFTSWVPGLRRRPAVHRRRPERPRVRVDAPVLRQAHRREQGPGAADVGLVGAPLLDQRQRRPVERLEREQGPGRRLHARAVVRAVEGRRPPRRLHRRPRAGARTQFDPQRRVKLAIDEWGSWHKPGSEAVPSHTLGQVSTLRDALLAGLSLDIFHRHADRVGMANLAQLVNCLQALFVAHEDKFVVTPNYHVFDMYKAHMGAESVRAVFSAPSVGYDRNGAAGADLGAQRLGVAQGQDGDADGGEPEPRHAARGGHRRRRRAHRVVHDAHADGRRRSTRTTASPSPTPCRRRRR